MSSRTMWTLGLVVGPLLLSPSAPAVAEQLNTARAYADCLAMARATPEQAYERAQTWEAMGGGEPARHCVAIALLGLGKLVPASRLLQELAEQSRRPPAIRAGMLAQAAQAMLLAGRPGQANALLGAALALTPDDVRLLVDRATVLAEARNYWEAIDDLNRALDLEPNRVEALVFRAAAYRYLDTFDLARQDVDQALTIAPNSAEALLERGILERLTGDPKAARRDWMAILRLDPTTPTADAARRNIELLDVKVTR
ncbi:MAG: hypothetical protein H7840_05845 [Alphaproteobacteria bacterium]